MKQQNQTGFAVVETLLVVVILALIGGTGYYVWHSKQATNRTLTTTNVSTQASVKSKPILSSEKKILLASSKVSFVLPAGFGVHSKGNTTGCYENTDTTAECVDTALLTLNSESYSNSDQFHVLVSVFTNAGSSDARTWFENELKDGQDTNHSYTEFQSSSGLKGIEYLASYEDENRTQYVLASGKYAVTVYADFFKGAHYSYSTDKNYNMYKNQVESLVKSITVQ